MGQYWNFVCIDRKECCDLRGKMGEMLFRRTPDIILELLTIREFKKLVPLPVVAPQASELSTIERLPLEIQLHICSYLETMDDAVCFALTSRSIFNAAQQEVAVRFKAMVAPWAGKRIICVGDYADDYPKGLISKDERGYFPEHNLFNHTCGLREVTVFRREHIYECTRAMGSLFASPMHWWNISSMVPVLEPPPTNPVLRNLSTKEYIRSSAVPNNFHFGHILLLQACWTSDPSMSLGYGQHEELCHGPWAGHRFDIVTPDHVDSSWTDVSDEVVPKIDMIIRAG